MSNIYWDHEAHLLRSSGAGETVEATGVLHQLVGAFLEMPPEQQRGLAIRLSGPDWTREYGASEIRELAAHPEYTGTYGRSDTAADTDEAALCDTPDPTLVVAGVSGLSAD